MFSPAEWFDLFHGSSWIQEAMAEAASPLKDKAQNGRTSFPFYSVYLRSHRPAQV